MSSKCSLCGKDKLLIKFKTKTGLCLCTKCYNEIPYDLTNFALNEWDRIDYEELDLYKDTFKNVSFTETIKQGVMSLDENNFLYKLSADDFIYSFNYLAEFSFGFEIDDRKPEKNGYKKVDFVVNLKADYPRHDIKVPLSIDMKVPSDVPEEEYMDYVPADAKEFMDKFNIAFRRMQDPEGQPPMTEREYLQELDREAAMLMDALKVMEYETLDGVSKKGLLRRKQMLLKPGKVISMQRIQEVNAAYDLLLETITNLEDRR